MAGWGLHPTTPSYKTTIDPGPLQKVPGTMSWVTGTMSWVPGTMVKVLVVLVVLTVLPRPGLGQETTVRPDSESTGTATTQQEVGYQEDGNASSPWPPDDPPTTPQVTTTTPTPRAPVTMPPADTSDDSDVTTATPEYDVMQNKTFQVTLGVCMSLVGLLMVLLVLMMFYTKYRGWKDRMNVAPTVRTGGQVGTDRQELMT